MFRRRKVSTVTELQAEIDAWTSDEEENEVDHRADKINIVITPPDKVDDGTDNEDMDDDTPMLDNNIKFVNEMPGQFEIEYIYDDDNANLPVVCELVEEMYDPLHTDNDPQASTSRKRRRVSVPKKPKWSKTHKYKFDKQPVDNEENAQNALYKIIGLYEPLQLWECFFDEEVLNMIVESTNEYAEQKNVTGFVATSITELKTFLGILYLTGYNTRPTMRSYWSNQASLGCQIVRDAISRDRFQQIKQNMHVCDNTNLDANDKFAKITPLNDALNKRFMQFGVFAHNLSVDEQIIDYNGRHSLKMFRGKPIRFGYKYWVLASATGYCYFFIPYSGAAANNNADYGLGENVVLRLLENLSDPTQHNITFNNYFASHKLLCLLTQRGYFATGTVRNNHTNYAPLDVHKLIRRKPRGSSDSCFDTNNKILAVRWNDNSVITVMSNFLGVEPICQARRFDHKNRKMGTIEQPHLIHQYNQRMGGVDLFDKAVHKYRIQDRGNKWYWPLLTNAMDAAMVNAWKLHCICRKVEGAPLMSKLDFRVSVVEALITIPETRSQGYNKKVVINAQIIAKRMDGLDHMIDKIGKRGRCAQCVVKTEFGCKKCNVNLHPKNCFAQFHAGIPKNTSKIKNSK